MYFEPFSSKEGKGKNDKPYTILMTMTRTIRGALAALFLLLGLTLWKSHTSIAIDSNEEPANRNSQAAVSPRSHKVLSVSERLQKEFDTSLFSTQVKSLMPINRLTGPYKFGRQLPGFTPQTSINLTLLVLKDTKALFDEPMDAQLYCEICLLHTQLCRDDESAEKCIHRIGPGRMQRLLPIRCSQSSFIKRMVDSAPSPDTSIEGLYRGLIPESVRMPRNEDLPKTVVPRQQRPDGRIPAGRVFLRAKCIVNRIPMSIPEEAIVRRVERNKVFDFNPLLPLYFPFREGENSYRMGTQDEPVVRELLSRSFFAWTHRRACWTAQRHYDILASGAVPVFLDLHLCEDDQECLPGYPVHIARKVRDLPGISWMFDSKNQKDFFHDPASYANHPVINPRKPGVIDHSTFDREAYYKLADELLNYTRSHLTTTAVAAHFLRVMGVPEPKGYVFIQTFAWLPDTCGLVHGLAALGVKVLAWEAHGVLKNPYGTEEEEAARRRNGDFWHGYRGAGHLYGHRTLSHNYVYCRAPGVNCSAYIERGEVDVAVYNAYGNDPELALYDELSKALPAERIAFLDGLDQATTFDATANNKYTSACSKGHILFSREMPDPSDW